jgi:hypothetical protein
MYGASPSKLSSKRGHRRKNRPGQSLKRASRFHSDALGQKKGVSMIGYMSERPTTNSNPRRIFSNDSVVLVIGLVQNHIALIDGVVFA